MKRKYTYLLIVSLVCAILTVLLCYITLKYCMKIEPFGTTNKVYNEVQQAGSSTPGAGEYFLIAGGISMIADFAALFLVFCLVMLLPAAAAGIISLLQLISRLIQIGVEKSWKNKTSKVMTYITGSLHVVLSLFTLFLMFGNFISNRIPLLIVLAINLSCAILHLKVARLPLPEIIEEVKNA